MSEEESQKVRKAAQKPRGNKPVSLKQLAEHLSLNPATVSVVLNDVPGRSIPQHTRDRIKAAARELNYQPNLLARSLRSRRTLTIGILVPELGDGYHAAVMSGIGDELMRAGYFYFTAHHRFRQDLVEEYTRLLVGRGAQGILSIDTQFERTPQVPTVAIAGHGSLEGITNVVLDHARAAELALGHLYELGHRRIAFLRGQSFSSDSAERWEQYQRVARDLGLVIEPELVVQLDHHSFSPELGYPIVNRLLDTGRAFTALVAYNDLSAIGATRALRDRQLRVPEDVSVIGFDNIYSSAYTSPSVTTINQPLEEMGRIATRKLLERISGKVESNAPMVIEPTLVVRESTGPAKS